ncbi:MAG: hypothetical protein ACHQET_14415 [Chitinophagales bacterium]
MKNSLTLPLLMLLSSLSDCIAVRNEYFLSPTNASSNPYHAIPMVEDSMKSANYVSGIFTAGTANDKGFDNLYSFQASFHRSHQLDAFQAYYGANMGLGNYEIAEYFRTKPNDGYYGLNGSYMSPYDTTFHIPKSNSFFGNVGINGGINVVLPFERGEWRPFGLEFSAQNEFGNYYGFRKNLPDTAADIIFKNNLTFTLGFYMDIIGKTRHGSEFGYKMAYGFLLNSLDDFTRMTRTGFFPVTYFSNTFHLTKGRVTGFVQLNIGTYATNFQTGMSYRLGKK